ncbi:MAG: elongation factor P [Puniceicoccales bacterium]|jgi:elongation factor P|nr:elongation factor P [Puniceicoccales bacterium]
MASPTDIRRGKVLVHGGVPHMVIDAQHRTQGRQAGFVQVTMRNLRTGTAANLKIRTTESVEFCFLERKKLEFSYRDGDDFYFLDTDSLEYFPIPGRLVEDIRAYLVEGSGYDVLLIDGKPIGVELPAAVEMTVREAPDGVRGDSASNVQKPATLESGLVVQVPLFVKSGDRIRVGTEKANYLGRA